MFIAFYNDAIVYSVGTLAINKNIYATLEETVTRVRDMAREQGPYEPRWELFTAYELGPAMDKNGVAE